MNYIVWLRREAEKDLAAAADWYERQHFGLVQNFLDEFMLVRQRLVETPLIYPIVYKK